MKYYELVNCLQMNVLPFPRKVVFVIVGLSSQSHLLLDLEGGGAKV